jgi:two-component system cell cycle sensor histidine kinase/response regulator CckA
MLLPLVGRTDNELCANPAEAANYHEHDRRVVRGETVTNVEETLTRPDGRRLTLLTSKVPLRDETGAVVGVLGVYRDITERKRLEEQLRQAQKMEAVGQLTAGIAHNFNNALSVIIHNAALCRDGADAETTDQLSEIEYAAQRAAEMVRQLMIFARADTHARKTPIDLVRSVERTVEISPYAGSNPLFLHGPVPVAPDRRHSLPVLYWRA